MGVFWGRAATPDTRAGRQRRKRLSQSRCLCWHLFQFTGETQAPCSYSTDNATEVPRLRINKVDVFHFFLWLWNCWAEGCSLISFAGLLLVCFYFFYYLLVFLYYCVLLLTFPLFHVHFQCGCLIHPKIKRIRPRSVANIKERNRWMFSLMQYWYCHVYSSTHFPPESNQADKRSPQGCWFRHAIDPSCVPLTQVHF